MNLSAFISNSANQSYHVTDGRVGAAHIMQRLDSLHLGNGALKMVLRFFNSGSYEIVSKQHFKTISL